jgi:hypothetical protein
VQFPRSPAAVMGRKRKWMSLGNWEGCVFDEPKPEELPGVKKLHQPQMMRYHFTCDE